MADILSIDRAGRLVVPKRLRAELGLREGRKLQIRRDGERLVLEPVPEEPELVEEGGLLVIRGHVEGDVPDHRAIRDARIARLQDSGDD